MFDMRTLLSGYLLSSGICALVLAILWRQNRGQPGMGFWLADFTLQFVGLLLVVLRGAIPDFFSMVVANLCIVGGTLLLLIGLERFAGRPSPQRINYLILAVFAGIHTYFTVVQPSLQARNVNFSLGLAVFCLQGVWLVFRRADAEMRRNLQLAGIVLAVIGGLSLLRVPIELVLPPSSDFFASGLFVALLMLAFQMLYLMLTFALTLAVNRRLRVDLQNDIAAREQANTALRHSEDLFAKVFRSSPYAITITQAEDGQIIDINDAFTAMSGFSRAEALASTTVGLNVWVDLADRAAVIEALHAGKPIVGREMTFRRRNGEIFPVSFSAQLVELSGRPAILTSVEDITARKQSEQALRESEERLELVMEGSQLGYWDWNILTGDVHRNERWAEMLGYTLEEIAFSVKQWTDLHHPDDREGAWRSIRDHLEGRTPAHRAEYRMLAKDGRYRWILDQARVVKRDAQGKPLRMSGTHTDITERKQIEEALRISQAETQTLLEAIPDLMFELDRDGRILSYHNPTDEVLYAPPGAFLDKTVPEVLPAPAAAIVMAALAEADRQGWRRGATYMLDIAGEQHWFELSLQVQHGAPATAKRFVALVRDVSERRRHEAELAQARDAAEAANRAKSQFLANMSHELRTPLNAILGFSELMSRDNTLDQAQRETLGIINRSGGHLLRLINSVLDMAKIESGRITLQEQDFDLAALLSDVVALFQARAEAKGLVLTLTQGTETPRYIYADEGKLRQVLSNLLSNAVKFTEAGAIDVTVQPVSADDGERLLFAVQDSGSGIAPEHLQLVFDSFVQAPTNLTLHEGTGLGLAISQHLVRLLGGELRAASTGVPGEGSRFTFTIPLHCATSVLSSQVAAGGRRVASLAPGQPRYRLLVVEDHPESRRLLAQLLTEFGFDVRSADHGLAALQLWEAWQPHLIWMDMRMPVMDGHAATRSIKAAAQGQPPIIIALTASVFESERASVIASGCDDFVRKPFREEEIVACLVKHLGVRMVYGAAPPVTPAAASPAFDLTGLPAGWVTQVQQAAVAADAVLLLELAAAIEVAQPALADALRAWVAEFNYDAALTAIAPVTSVASLTVAAPLA